MEACSVFVDKPLTNATSEHLEVLSSPSEAADKAGEWHLGSGQRREAEPMPCGERPSPSCRALVSVLLTG